ncbi:hypothetical protein B0J12DRAFT_99667 [Macrophomina phaseolina]|uniref:Uncharacterized protein n=1 Tax=Macrophomina phaseolina TaxID=35725 RepID=A0ABQ8G9K9_9PEZI|nr:hypothetical protein B0J12DRAFT_99667 [Macrophomina phaseolina]
MLPTALPPLFMFMFIFSISYFHGNRRTLTRLAAGLYEDAHNHFRGPRRVGWGLGVGTFIHTYVVAVLTVFVSKKMLQRLLVRPGYILLVLKLFSSVWQVNMYTHVTCFSLEKR